MKTDATRATLHQFIRDTLGRLEEDYDIDTIADDIYAAAGNWDPTRIDSDHYWRIVYCHQKLNPILKSPVAELHDRLDHAAGTARKVLDAALALNISPAVEHETDGSYTRVTWSRIDIDTRRGVRVLTHWSSDDPTPDTVIDLDGEFSDDYDDVTTLISALSAAQTLRIQLADLIP
ncbi:hypothetical protein [Gordonia humi]|nr:hypothetical protein [Gordonia humi]